MAKKFNSIWPPPVYCAQFADGEIIRMSFSTPSNKPLDFERGRRLCCGIKGDEIAPKTPNDPGYFESPTYRRLLREVAQALFNKAIAEVFPGIVRDRFGLRLFRERLPRPAPAVAGDGWVERDGKRIDDPHFAPSDVVDLGARRRAKTAIEKAIALLPALSAADRAALMGALAERMAA